MNHTPSYLPHTPPSLPPTTPNPNPPPDLPTAISSLSSLIHDSSRILDSLSTLLPIPTQHNNSGSTEMLVSCPFNSNHRLHPRSLFPHSLHCPRPLHHLIPPLHYPETLQSTADQSHSSFIQTTSHPGSDLCLSLEHYYAEFGCNFFYRDCPAVVKSTALDDFDATFTLPSVLAAECSNSNSSITDCDKVCSKLMPSEFCAVEKEVQGWSECPCLYSRCVLRAVLGLGLDKECDLGMWIVANSPKYGIVIDVALGDHVVVLVSLCLRAIVREAFRNVDCRDSESGGFECPNLVEALVWLASQLAKLYGELNAKSFALDILKHCVLVAALRSVVFPFKQKETEFHGLEEEGSCAGNEDDTEPVSTEMKNIIINKVVSVSQVAAAVAALHERFLLEERIKGERVQQTLTRHQRVLEHDYVSQIADEERKHRSHYRPIIDHDGLPRQKSSNQETNKTKTKEELLAEERDYKRRRMSYRGKKVKRTTLQVTRDIIEEYMEEIKQAGGIGCFERAIEGQGSIQLKLSSDTDFSTDHDNPTKNNRESEGRSPSRFRKLSHSRHTTHSTTSRHASAKDHGKPSSLHREYQEDSGSLSNSRDTSNYSRSPKRSRSREGSHWQSEQAHGQRTSTKHRDRNHASKYHDSRSKYDDNRSSSVSYSQHKSSVNRNEKTYESHGSYSLGRDTFDDRYDPLESDDRYEEDQSSSIKYAREGRHSSNEQTWGYK